MTDQEVKSISFVLRNVNDPIGISFFHFGMDTLHQIVRILDIEGFTIPLIINVDRELYWEIGQLLCQNHWLFNFAVEKEPDEFNIVLDGFNLIFKRVTE